MRVLIADDDAVTRHLLLRTLQNWGYQVTAARDGDEAWRLFEADDFPMVVSDWVMPGLDGVELVRRIRAAGRPGYVFTVLLTARSEKEDVAEGMAAGADDFLPKPFNREELRMRLRVGERILRLEERLLEQNRLLSERNAEMEEDLRMACEVQQALLPQGYPSFPAHVPPEHSHLRFCDRYRPNGAVGGDFFDVLALSDTKAGVFICDVMGHGVRAALVTAMVRALLESFRTTGDDPGRFLGGINQELIAILGQSSLTVFLSAFYLIIDTTTGEAQYANAGHPLPLWVRRSAEEVVVLAQPGGRAGPPLGVRSGACYAVGHVQLVPNDMVVLFTDGLHEVSGPEQEPLGEDRLREIAARRLSLPRGRLLDEILSDVLRFTAGKGFDDDVCILGVELASLGA